MTPQEAQEVLEFYLKNPNPVRTNFDVEHDEAIRAVLAAKERGAAEGIDAQGIIVRRTA